MFRDYVFFMSGLWQVTGCYWETEWRNGVRKVADRVA